MKERIKAAAILASAYLVYVAVLSLMYGCASNPIKVSNAAKSDLDHAQSLNFSASAHIAAAKPLTAPPASLELDAAQKDLTSQTVDITHASFGTEQMWKDTQAAQAGKKKAEDALKTEQANFWSYRQRHLFYLILGIGTALFVGYVALGIFGAITGASWIVKLLPAMQIFEFIVGLFRRK